MKNADSTKLFVMRVRLQRIFFLLLLWETCLLYSLESGQGAAPRIIKVAYIDSGINLQRIGEQTYTGYTAAYLSDIADYTGWEYEYVSTSPVTVFQDLDKGVVDLVPLVFYTEERAQAFSFPNYGYGNSSFTYFVKSDSPIDADNYDTLKKNVTVAVVTASQSICAFETFASRHNLQYNFFYCKTFPEVATAVKNGKADAGVAKNYHNFDGTKTLAHFASQPYYFITRRNEPEILDGLNFAMRHLLEQDPEHDSKLFALFNAKNDTYIAYTPEEIKYIENAGTFRVLFTDFWEPLAIVDSKSGDVSGILPDILNLAAKRMRLPIQIISDIDKSVPTQSVFAKKNIDIIGCFIGRDIFADSIGITLSDAYFDVSLLQITNPEIAGDFRYYAIMFLPDGGELPGVAGLEPLLCSNAEECLEALKTGRVSKAFINAYSAINLLSDIKYSAFDRVTLQGTTQRIRMAFPDDVNPILVSIINKTLKAVTLTERNEIIMDNIFIEPKSVIHTIIRAHSISLIIGLIIFFTLSIMAILYVASLKNRRLEHKKNCQLEAALQIAEKSSAAKGDFLSHMSHEIRTPLNAIIGYTSIALSAFDQTQPDITCKDSAKVLDSLKKNDIASTHLLSVINDVLDMSAIESGNIKIAHERFSLKDLISSITLLFSTLVENKGINLDITMKDFSADWFTGDEMRIGQILTNLLSNAVKFTPRGGCIKFIITEMVRSLEHSTLCFVVSDTGIGMDVAFLQNLWKPFNQENASINRFFGGSGLGLSITKSLVDILGGTISVESTKNVGSIFTVTLSLPHAVPAEKIVSPVSDDTVFDGKRILLVEDNEMNMEITRQILSEKNFEVVNAWNGAEAVEMFIREGDSYDIILMDVQMPVMDGLESARRIRASEASNAATIPIFAMTADVFSESIASIKESGMTGYIPKPFNKDKLFAMLQNYC